MGRVAVDTRPSTTLRATLSSSKGRSLQSKSGVRAGSRARVASLSRESGSRVRIGSRERQSDLRVRQSPSGDRGAPRIAGRPRSTTASRSAHGRPSTSTADRRLSTTDRRPFDEFRVALSVPKGDCRLRPFDELRVALSVVEGRLPTTDRIITSDPRLTSVSCDREHICLSPPSQLADG
jgi:hypothetical protein